MRVWRRARPLKILRGARSEARRSLGLVQSCGWPRFRNSCLGQGSALPPIAREKGSSDVTFARPGGMLVNVAGVTRFRPFSAARDTAAPCQPLLLPLLRPPLSTGAAETLAHMAATRTAQPTAVPTRMFCDLILSSSQLSMRCPHPAPAPVH